ncbi:MraY family glycosyltransferase [Spirosoma rhododendri]|uniref:Uncharacterized protein n=1 Tax=Spirosoma rhododendri TaxID=2728024 RepID=A0A7L5DR27_9BACT|nr:hypothetical protein [Spirosoma rhododendri]QJD79911.1 hypothetical protein HH216_16930 [Spirosoma rhododendri]
MEAIFIIALFSLVANPIIGMILVKVNRNRPDRQKMLARVSVGTLAFVSLALFTNVSTSSDAIDCVFLGLFYLAICVLLWLGTSKKNKVSLIFSSVLLVILFGLSCLFSTIGILGLAFIVGEFEPSRSVRINGSTLYREYGRGNATTATGGSEVSLFTSFRWFPFVERKFFSKQYISGFATTNDNKQKRFTTPENSPINNTPTFYGTHFKLTYDTTKNDLILSYQQTRDTLHLDR